MENARPVLNWEDQQSVLLLNPYLAESEKRILEDLYKKFDRPAHLFIASSGSTASAEQSLKLIALSKTAFLASAASVNQHLQVSPNDKWLLALPAFHVGGLSILARAYLSVTEVVEFSGKWNAKKYHDCILQNAVTLSSLVPTQIFDLVNEGFKSPESLRALVVGGAALSPELYHKARALGWPLLPSFGMTECASQIATAELQSLKGDQFPELKVLPHLQVKMEETLSVSGSSLLTGYAQLQKGEAVWVDPVRDGWFVTEDRVLLQGEYLRPLGRAADFVKILGEGVHLEPLRQKLQTHFREKFQKVHDLDANFIDEITLVDVADERAGAQIVMVVSGRLPGRAAKSLFESYNQIAVGVEKSHALFQVPEIPRSPLGKILMGELRIKISRASHLTEH